MTRLSRFVALAALLFGVPVLAAGPWCVSVSGEVVRDGDTGLAWTRRPVVASWDDALAHCNSLEAGGFSDGWHLPSAKELATLYEAAPVEGSTWSILRIDPDVFPAPATDDPGLVWTSTVVVGATNQVFTGSPGNPTNGGPGGTNGAIGRSSLYKADGITPLPGRVLCVH